MRTLTAGGSQAVNELQVFLRAVSETQRRWAKRIATQEAKVRRCMILEDNCRKKLRKSVLRFTNEQLKYLENTDPLGNIGMKFPPLSAFKTFQIPTKKLSGFSIFAMARLNASPASLLDVPKIVLIADLIGAWEILPPSKKERYESFAESIKYAELAGHVTSDTSQTLSNSLDGKEKDNINDDTMWEARAYSCFLSQGRRQLEAALGSVKETDWLTIAPKEWKTLTLRQKRCYLQE